tara:strand:+ start:70392 stop:71021 length:630 start_codon:yes stop_codon:yes gene_type:complete
MNYLAHLFLGPQDPEQALGSLLGDFVRGPVDKLELPDGVRHGIWLHRRIDSFTDAHEVVAASRARVTPERRRYAGIMIDMFYDHLLARHWDRFADQSIGDFTRQMYSHLLAQRDVIPANAWPVIERMAEQDWLSSYARIGSLHRALDNISLRLRRTNTLPGSADELERDYAGFEADFLAFMPQVIAFADSQALTTGEAAALPVSTSPKA